MPMVTVFLLLSFFLPDVGATKIASTSTCPDFSGQYWFPGIDEMDKVCEHTTRFGIEGLLIPVIQAEDIGARKIPYGGFSYVHEATAVTIEQRGCNEILFRAPFISFMIPGSSNPRRYESHVREYLIRLPTGSYHEAKSTWTENSLEFTASMRGRGFSIGPDRVSIRLYLELTETGLIYEIAHWKGKRFTKGRMDSHCVLKRITQGE